MTITRRTVLKGLTLSLSAAALGLRSLPAPAAPTPTPSPSASPFVRTPPDLTPIPAPGSGWVHPRQPYSLSSSVQLSEDYFSTDQITLGDPADRVLAFGYEGQTGALVLAGGKVSCLWPDPSSPSGWSYGEQNFNADTVDQLAVGTDADGTVYALWAMTGQGDLSYTVPFFRAPGKDWASIPAVLPAVPDGATLLPCYDLDGRLNFSAVAPDGSFGWWTPSPGGCAYEVNTAMVGAQVEQALIVPSHRPGTGQGLQFVAWALIGSELKRLVDGLAVGAVLTYPQASTLLTAGNFAGQPYVTWMNQSQDLCAVYGGEPVSFDNPFAGSPSSLLSGEVSQPDGSTGLSFVLVAGGQLYVSAAQPGGTTPPTLSVPPSVPLQGEVVSAAVSATGVLDTVFYVDASLGLNCLRRNPTTGAWQDFPIHQDGTTSTSVQMWRAELTVLDGNGTPVPALDITLTAVDQIDLWHEAGGSLLEPGGTATFTTNVHGRVTVAIPAAELSTTGFTVSASGLPPVLVAPDGDVHTYLSGTGTLNTLPVMTGSTLQAAQTGGTGSVAVFPSSMSTDTATAAASAIGQGMLAGAQAAQQQAPGAGQTQSFTVSLVGGSATYTSSTQPQDLTEQLRRLGAPVGSIGSWWDKVKHDAESVYHGIRSGVIAVTHAAGTFLSSAEGWAMKLAIQIGDDITDAIDLAVKDLRSAIHFISSVFQALGADIVKALKWLRAEILGLFTHTVTAADTLYGWLTDAQENISPLVTSVQNDVDTYFTGVKNNVNTYLTDPDGALNGLRGETLSTLAAPPPTIERADGQRGAKSRGALGDPDPSSPTGASSAHGNWLLHKVESFLPTMTSPYSAEIGTDFTAMLATFGADAFDAVTSDALGLWHAMVDSLSDPQDLKTKGVGEILDALAAVVDSMLDLLQLVIDDLLQLVQTALSGFADVLAFPLDDIPIIGDLLRLAGVSDSFTIGRLACLVAMFPAVLAKQVVTGDPTRELFEFPADDAARRRAGEELTITEATGLNYAAAALQGMLTAFAVVDALTDEGGAWSPPDPIDYFTSVVPNVLLVGLLVVSWPGDGHPRYSDRPFSRPMPTASAVDRLAISVYSLSYLEWALDVVSVIETLVGFGESRSTAKKTLKWLNSGLGLFLVVVGCTSAGESKQGGAVIAGQFLSEFTLMWSFLEDDDVEKATEETSFPAGMLLDFFCGAGAAVAFAAS